MELGFIPMSLVIKHYSPRKPNLHPCFSKLFFLPVLYNFHHVYVKQMKIYLNIILDIRIYISLRNPVHLLFPSKLCAWLMLVSRLMKPESSCLKPLDHDTLQTFKIKNARIPSNNCP